MFGRAGSSVRISTRLKTGCLGYQDSFPFCSNDVSAPTISRLSERSIPPPTCPGDTGDYFLAVKWLGHEAEQTAIKSLHQFAMKYPCHCTSLQWSIPVTAPVHLSLQYPCHCTSSPVTAPVFNEANGQKFIYALKENMTVTEGMFMKLMLLERFCKEFP
jgi:hypothetical protein